MSQTQAATHDSIQRQTLSDHLNGRRGKKSSSRGRTPIIPLVLETRLPYSNLGIRFLFSNEFLFFAVSRVQSLWKNGDLASPKRKF
jgi:hypothetical protein